MALILQEVGFLFCLNTVKNMQQTDLKPICIYIFFLILFLPALEAGYWNFWVFLAHSLFGSCSFDKCCVVAQPKAVGFGDFFFSLYLYFCGRLCDLSCKTKC